MSAGTISRPRRRDAEIADFTRTIGQVAAQVGADQQGYRLLSNIGKRGGQEVPHLHVHLFGGAAAGADAGQIVALSATCARLLQGIARLRSRR